MNLKCIRLIALLAMFILPYSMHAQTSILSIDFEDEFAAGNWQPFSGPSTNVLTIGDAVYQEGMKSMYVSDDGGMTHHYSNTSVSTAYMWTMLYVPTAGRYDVSYDWMGVGMLNNDYMRVCLAPMSVQLEGGTLYDGLSYNTVPSDWIALDGGSQLNQAPSWQHFANTLTLDAGRYWLVVCWTNNGLGGMNPPAAIDNIEIKMAQCSAPTQLSVSNVVDDHATISWQGGGLATSWMVEYGESGFNEGDGVLVPTSVPSVTLSNLLSDASYDVYVKSVCGVDEMSESVMIQFRSDCDVISLPYSNGFEANPTNEFPNCWTNIAGNNSVALGNSYLPAHSGNKMLRIKDEATIASPLIPLTASDVVADFWVKRENYVEGDLVVGYATDLSQLDNMTILTTISFTDNEWHYYEIDCSSLPSTLFDGYLVMKQVNPYSYSPSLLLDDVHIDQAPTCKRPNNLVVSQVSYNGATFTWDATESGAYEIRYGVVNDVENSENMIESSFVNSFVATDLMSNTTYYVWVRSECDSENSDWSFVAQFTTDVSCASVTDLTISNIQASGAVANWNTLSSVGIAPTAVEVAWKATTDLNYTKQITTGNHFIFSNLQSNTDYEVSVRAICNSDTAQSATTTFTTIPCGVAAMGDGNSYSMNVPADCNMQYSYAQMLYPASDLDALDSIRGLAFNIKTICNTITRNWDIYLAHTASNSLTYATCIPPFRMTLMATVQQSLTEGWNIIQFDSAFAYDHSSNLVVIVDDNTGNYSCAVDFYGHPGSAIYSSSSYSNINPASPSEMSEESKVPDIIFIDNCAATSQTAPLLTVASVASNQVDLVWDNKGANITYRVEYRMANDPNWTLFNTTSTNHITVTGLQAGTQYEFRVGTVTTTSILYSTTTAFTECDVIAAPWYEDFTYGIDVCWTTGSTSSVTPSCYGGKVNLGYLAGGYLVTPQFEATVNNLQVSFTFQSYNIGSKLEIAVGSNPNDYTTFVPIDTLSTTGYAMEAQLCLLSSYQGEGRYIAFHSLSDGISLDNIAIEIPSSCEAPNNVQALATSASSVDVIWEGDHSLTVKWIVDYQQQGDSIIHSIEVPADDLGYTLDGLLPNTSYQLWVSNVCQSGDTLTILNPIVFRTLCAELVLDEVATFESETENEFPNCWYHINDAYYEIVYSPYAKESYTAPVVVNTESDNHKALNLFKGVDVISPLVPLQANQIMINFDAMCEDVAYAGDLLIGFSTSNTDLSNMVVVDTLHFSDTQWDNYDVSFASLSATDEGYVVFQNINYLPFINYRNDSTYKACYIDNISIMQDFGCARLTNPTLLSIADNAVTLSFTDPANTANYDIAYGTSNKRSEAIDTLHFTTTSYQLQALQPNTRYYAWIRNHCSAGPSPWTEVPMFHTSCSAVELPYTEDFSSYNSDIMSYMNTPASYPFHTMPQCWTIRNMSSNSSTYPHAYLFNSSSSYNNYSASGTCLLMLSKAHGSLFAVLPQFDTTLSDLQISFTYRQNTTEDNHAQLELGVMTNVMDTNSFVTLQSYPRTTILDTITHNFGLDAQLNPTTLYRIAFRYRGGICNSDKLGLDDISVVASPNCIIPEHLTATNITASSATLSWLGNATSYQVCYRQVGATIWQSQSASTTAITLSNLNFATTYEVKVQSQCANALSSEWSNIYTFTTECGSMAIPYIENFESYTTDVAEGNNAPQTYPYHAMPLCWSFPEMHHNPKIFISHNDVYACDSSQCLFFVSSNERSAYAVLPAMSLNLEALQLHFFYRNETVSSSCGALTVGVMTNPNDTTTFIPLESYAREVELTQASHLFTNDEELSANTPYYIAFRYGDAMGNGYYLGLDSIVVDYAPTCETPINLTAQEVTTTTVHLSWSGNSDCYDVEYRAQGFSEWIEAASLIADTHLVLNTLQSATTYEWHVRAHCLMMNDTTDWATSTFQTLASPCDKPTQLTATPGETMVVLDWNAPSSQSDWTINIFSDDENLTFNVNDHPTTVNDLLSGTDYHVAVRANCSEDNSSEWSDTIHFTTTTHPCNPVSHVSVSNITLHTAILSWTAGGDEEAWDIAYNEQGASEQSPTIVSSDLPQYGLSGLEAHTTYEVKVRAACTAELFSEWSAPITFTTLSTEGIDGIEGNYQFTIYPNPTHGSTTISLQGVEGKVIISVVDMNGRTINSETIECGSDCEKRIDVAYLAQGTYFVRILGDNLNSVRKLIVR